MRPLRFRFTIRSMMIAVVIAALTMTIGILLSHALDPLVFWDRHLRIGAVGYIVVVIMLTGIVALPFAIAVGLVLSPLPKDRVGHRLITRGLMAALAIALGLAIMNYPLDGLRLAYLLRDGSYVAFYHQYRIWPGEHVTPCLELITRNGRSRSYPIARNARYQGFPDVRTNAEQSVVWFVDAPSARIRHGGMWCSINRTTGEFVGAGGPYPTGVSETSGFPPTR